MSMSGSSAQTVVAVDDQPYNKQLEYSDGWTHLYSLGAPVNGTLSYASTVGPSAIFTFNGTGVGVVGSVLPVNATLPPQSVYSVDGGPTTTYTAPDNATVAEYGVTFFTTQGLSSGEHKLVINVTRASNDAPFLIDYFGYLQETTDMTTPTTSLTSAFSGATQTGEMPVSMSSGPSSVPVGPIVGGVIGGVALLVLTILVVWYMCIRRRHGQPYFYGSAQPADLLDQEAKPSPAQQVDPHPHVVPYSPPPPSTALDSIDPPTTLNGNEPEFSPYVPHRLPRPGSAGGTSDTYAPPPAVSGNNLPPSKGERERARQARAQARVRQQPTYNMDSGARFTPSGSGGHALVGDMEALDDVPPMYTEN